MSASNFLTAYLDLEPFAAEVDRDPRTVRRWLNEPDGLPFTRIGNRILIHIPTAREWLFSRMQRPNPRPTTKGHPRKAERAGVAARRAMTAIMKPAAIGARPASVFVNWQVGGSEDRPSQVLQQAIRAELAGSDSCSALGITISSSSPVLALCRKLVQAGFDPSTPLEVRRGETLSLRVRSIGEGARLEVNAKGNGFIARRAVRAGPSARKKTSGPAHDGDSPGFSASLCSSTAPTSWRGSYERGRGGAS